MREKPQIACTKDPAQPYQLCTIYISKQKSKHPVSFSKYKSIFLSSFNLKKTTSKKDTCNMCYKSD